MKRFVLIVLAALVMVSFVSCGGHAMAPEKAEPTPSATEETAKEETPLQMPETAPEEVEEAVPEAKSITTVGVTAADAPEEAVPEEAAAGDSLVAEGNGYRIEIFGVSKGQDYAGTPTIDVDCAFTNDNAADAAAVYWVKLSVSQKGQLCNPDGIVIMFDPMAESDNTLVSNGQSARYTTQYPLADAHAPVQITAQIFDFSTQSTISSETGSFMLG